MLSVGTFVHSHAIDFKKLWFVSSDQHVAVPGQQKLSVENYRLAKLNTSEFQLFQNMVPTEASGLMETISLPDPLGNEMQFRIFECPMMEKPLADKYPQIKTYTAIGIDNPTITAKLDFTVFGFHAKVFNGQETYFIDPYTDLTTEWYMIYYKKDARKPLGERMSCLTEDMPEQLAKEQAMSITAEQELPQISYKQNGTNKRTYRLALACTQEYAAAVGGANPTKASVLSAMVTSMNRVNGVFEKEFSMHANLVAKNDTLIFLSNDPYTNNNGGTMLGENQTVVTQRIGSANYDFGHVFSTGGGGIASLGCVCSNNSKAQGVTGSSNPVGDAYDIDYVAHEMGHQFGGNHTFNSVTGSCNGNRSSSSAYEPGSATTIMGYAGICGSDDIMAHSDDYYHVRSLESMTGTSVMACAANVASNNGLPTLNPIAATHIIPYRTSFELTASGSDPDNDVLTYCWEEYDRGGSGCAWDAVTTVAPILRSFLPVSSTTRVFPTLSYLLQNLESYKGERLPDNVRMLRFRCTLRDIHNGYGAFYTSTDTLKLDVRSTTGLFRVTSHNTAGQSLNAFGQTTVTWDVAGTDAAPFTASNVDIYFSADSGKTWPYVMASGVPNNGSKVVGVPNVSTNWGRIKVKGAGNVFFDLNDKWIKVNAAPAGVSSFNENEISVYPNPNKGNFVIDFPAQYKTAEIEVLSGTGQVLHMSQISQKESVNLADLASGIYFVKIKLDGSSVIRKMLIE